MARGKKGQILMLALLVMFVGAVILAGLFQYLGSSLLLATRGDENAVNYYAADSGIEDALYGLLNNQSYEQNEYILNYTNSGMNNRIVNVSVVNDPYDLGNSIGDSTYLITSTATHNKSGASTKIKSYIRATPLQFWEFGDDAITSNDDVTIRGDKGWVYGDVSYVDSITCNPDPCAVNGTINEPFEDGIPWWPEAWAIARYFEDQVENAVHITGDVEIDMALNASLGPLYVDGNLKLYTSVNNAKASLAGIVYVTGDLTFVAGGSTHFTLNLSDQVIFVENEGADIGGNPSKGNAEVLIDSDSTLAGSGAIFAIGDIWFAPKLSTSPQEFLFIMSIEGWLKMQPDSRFYGSIAGNLQVDVSPQDEIRRTEDDDFWNTFLDPEPVILKILTYDIVDR